MYYQLFTTKLKHKSIEIHFCRRSRGIFRLTSVRLSCTVIAFGLELIIQKLHTIYRSIITFAGNYRGACTAG